MLVPVLRDDLDLDWAEYEGSARIAQNAGRGLWEPDGPLLGLDAIAERRRRRGPRARRRRSAGCGWAAAAGPTTGPWPGCRRVAPWSPCCTTASCLPAVPAEPHDRPVTAA